MWEINLETLRSILRSHQWDLLFSATFCLSLSEHLPVVHCILGEEDVGLEPGGDGAQGTLPSWQS